MAISCMRNASGHNYSFIVDLAIRPIPRSTERISSYYYARRAKASLYLAYFCHQL